jgi:hypothetical protein
VSNRILKRAGRAGVALVVGCSFAAPAQAAPPNLGTAAPFSVLAATTVTNTGASSMWGDLGLTPGSQVTGGPAVGGATYINDAQGVALRAKNDLTTAYVTTANLPASGSAGVQLAGRTFKAGVFKATTTLQLSAGDTVTLDGEHNPDGVFIFQVGTGLRTFAGARVALINEANPCNVFWQVGSDTNFGSGSSFVGTVMSGTSITDESGSTIDGRLLVNTAAVNLNNTTIIHSACATAGTGGTGGSGGTGGTGGSGGTGATPGAGAPAGGALANQAPPASRSATPTHNGTARLRRPPTTTASRRPPASACTKGFTATVRGHLINRVVFSLDGKRIGTRTKAAFRVYVRAAKAGTHVIKARVGFTDATHSKTLKFRYRACAAQVLQPRRGPSQFTG